MVDVVARADMVEAADALFYGRGIQAVGIDEVRTAANVSLKRLYAEFAGKEGLVLAVLDRRHLIWEEGLAAAAAGAGDDRARLVSIFDFLERWFTEETFRGCGFINAFGELGATSPAVASAVRDHKRSVLTYIETLVHRLGGDEVLAMQLLLLAEGAQTAAAIGVGTRQAEVARAAALVLIDAGRAAA